MSKHYNWIGYGLILLFCNQSISAYSGVPTFIFNNDINMDVVIEVQTTKYFSLTLHRARSKKMPGWLEVKGNNNIDIKFQIKDNSFVFLLPIGRSIVWTGMSSSGDGRILKSTIIKMIVYNINGNPLWELSPEDLKAYATCKKRGLIYQMEHVVDCTLSFRELGVPRTGIAP